MSDDPFARLDAVAANLPFAVDDYTAAAAAFVRWRAGGDKADWDTAVLWVYCYVLRYLYVRFRREPAAAVSDVEAVVDRTFTKTVEALGTVRHPEKLPQFVSVVCKRALLTYRQRCRPAEALDEERLAAPPRPDDFDRALVRWAAARAVESLPPALRPVARMRLLEKVPYAEIAEATGHPLPTVRTYVSKAIRRLREDPDLRALAFDDVLPRGAIPEPAEEVS